MFTAAVERLPWQPKVRVDTRGERDKTEQSVWVTGMWHPSRIQSADISVQKTET